MASPERRSAPRKIVTVRIETQTELGVLMNLSRNLSRIGVFIGTDQPLAPETEVEMTLSLSGKKIPVKGRVIWSMDRGEARPPGMGIQITRISPADQKLLEEFLRQH